MVHGHRPVARYGCTGLGHHLPVGDVQELQQANVFHAIAV